MPEKTRKPRSDRGTVRIQPRDIEIMRFIIEMDEVSLPQLQLLLARYSTHTEKPTVRIERVYQLKDRWEKKGWIKYRAPYEDGNVVGSVYATREAIKFFDYNLKARKRHYSRLPHIFAVNWVRLWLESWMKERRYTDFRWTAERILRHGKKLDTCPDAEVFYGGVTVAVQVELSDKTALDYRELAVLYSGKSVGSKIYPRGMDYVEIWYFVPEKIEAIMTRHFEPYAPRFKVISLRDKTLEDGSTYQTHIPVVMETLYKEV